MTTQTDKIVESVADALDPHCYDRAQAIALARKTILAHTEALMESVTEEMVEAPPIYFGPGGDLNHKAAVTAVFRAMLTIHVAHVLGIKEQMK